MPSVAASAGTKLQERSAAHRMMRTYSPPDLAHKLDDSNLQIQQVARYFSQILTKVPASDKHSAERINELNEKHLQRTDLSASISTRTYNDAVPWRCTVGLLLISSIPSEL